MKVLIIFSVLITLAFCQSEELTIQGVCKLLKDGNYVRDFESCGVYYQCVNGRAIEKVCPEGRVFDKEKEVCVVSNHCDPAAEAKCQYKVDGFVPDDSSCNGYYYCIDRIVQGRGECPKGQVFDKNLLGGSCVWENDKNKCNIEKDTNICEFIKSGEFFGSSDDCSAWNKCSKGTVINGTCENMVLDLSDGTCTYEADCRQTGGNIEKPVTYPPPSGTIQCKSGRPVFSSDELTCGGYYWCEPNAEIGIWGQCANNQFFDGKLCVDRTSLECDFDRCQGMGPGITWVNIKGDGCVGYNFCQDGRLMVGQKPGICQNGFFDEKAQICVLHEINYPACAKKETPSTSKPDSEETEDPENEVTEDPNPEVTDEPENEVTEDPNPEVTEGEPEKEK